MRKANRNRQKELIRVDTNEKPSGMMSRQKVGLIAGSEQLRKKN